MSCTPKEAMMDDEEIRAQCDCPGDRGGAGIDRSGDFANSAVVLDLQSVRCTGPVGELLGFERAVAVY